MSELSKTAKAAQKAVEKSQAKGVTARTPEQILSDIRKNLDARLAVTPDDQRWLLKQFDEHVELNTNLTQTIALAVINGDLKNKEIETLKAKIEEFRTVYEQENRSTTLRVDVVDSPETECGTITEKPVEVYGEGDES